MYLLKITNLGGLLGVRSSSLSQYGSDEENLSEITDFLDRYNLPEINCILMKGTFRSRENDDGEYIEYFSFAGRYVEEVKDEYFLCQKSLKHFFTNRNAASLHDFNHQVLEQDFDIPSNRNFNLAGVGDRKARGLISLFDIIYSSENDILENNLISFNKGPIRCIHNDSPVVFNSAEEMVTFHKNFGLYESHLAIPFKLKTVRLNLTRSGVTATPVVLNTFIHFGSFSNMSPMFSLSYRGTGQAAYNRTYRKYAPAPTWKCAMRPETRNLPEITRSSISNEIFSKIMLSSEFARIKEVSVLERAKERLAELSTESSVNWEREIESKMLKIQRYQNNIDNSKKEISRLDAAIDNYLEKIDRLDPESDKALIKAINADLDLCVYDVNYYTRLIQDREKQIEELLTDISSLQEKIDSFDDSKQKKLEKRIQLLVTKVKKRSTEILEGSTGVDWVENYRRSNFVLDYVEFSCNGSTVVANNENIDELLVDNTFKISRIGLYNETHMEIALDARQAMQNGLKPKTKIAGPLYYTLVFEDDDYPRLYIKPKDNTCIVGQDGDYFCLHPHTGTKYSEVEFTDFNSTVCLGEAEGGLAQARADKDIDLAIQFIIGWATNADTSDTWGVKANTYFPSPHQLNPLSKEEYLELLRDHSQLDFVSVEHKSKSNVVRIDATEDGWVFSKNRVSYKVLGSSAEEFVKVKLDKLNKSSVYTETNRI